MNGRAPGTVTIEMENGQTRDLTVDELAAQMRANPHMAIKIVRENNLTDEEKATIRGWKIG
jgi:hypothetical protein